VITGLFFYPIKACQGIAAKIMSVGTCGAHLDRAFCVVDVSGKRFPKGEAISRRRLPRLAGIRVRIEGEYLSISAREMKDTLKVPLKESAYRDHEDFCVSCSGMSTTSDGGWSLGHMDAKNCGPKASDWFTQYVRNVCEPKNEKTQSTRFTLVRSVSTRCVSKYAGPRQLPFSESLSEQRKGTASPFRMQKVPILENDRVRFHDSMPFLLCSEDSLELLTDRMLEALPGRDFGGGNTKYPMQAFRPNIVIRTKKKIAFSEESWGVFRVRDANTQERGTLFRQIKLCPRCTVPARSPTDGSFVIPKSKLLFMKTLKSMFPSKTIDREWGEEWQGSTFGVLVAHNGHEGELRVGDCVDIVQYIKRPGAHGNGNPAASSGCVLC